MTPNLANEPSGDQALQRAHCVVMEVLRLAELGDLPLVWLRPRSLALETLCQDDLDFLFDPSALQQVVMKLFDLCRAHGLSARLTQSDGFKVRFDVLVDAGQVLQFELWPHAEFRKHDSHGVFTRCAVSYEAFSSLPSSQHPSALAALFLLHLHHKEKDLRSSSVQERLRYFSGLPSLVETLRAAMLQMMAGDGSIEMGRSLAIEWIRASGARLTTPFPLQIQKWWREFTSLRVPAIRTVAVVGPDGSGKTTLMDACKASLPSSKFKFVRFKRYFRRVLVHVFRAEPRNVRDEKMLWLVLPVAWLHFMLARTLTGWIKTAVMDRYFYDYLAKDVRSESSPLKRAQGYAFLSSLIPRPAKVVIASCATPVITSRKAEMQPLSIDALYALYIDQVCRSRIKRVLFCNTNQPIEQASDEMLMFVSGGE